MAEIFEVAIEDDRDVPIENSHLRRGRCSCGATALYSPEHRDHAECGTCLADRVGRVAMPAELLGKYAPVVSTADPSRAAPRIEVGTAAYPRPEWTSRDAQDVPAPAVVHALAERVRRGGGLARVQSSRGNLPHGGHGRPLKTKTLHAVVMRAGDARWGAYAVHDGAGWISVVLWGAGLPWFTLATITELCDFIDRDGLLPDGWFEAIRERVRLADARRKAAPKRASSGKREGLS